MTSESINGMFRFLILLSHLSGKKKRPKYLIFRTVTSKSCSKEESVALISHMDAIYHSLMEVSASKGFKFTRDQGAAHS